MNRKVFSFEGIKIGEWCHSEWAWNNASLVGGAAWLVDMFGKICRKATCMTATKISERMHELASTRSSKGRKITSAGM